MQIHFLFKRDQMVQIKCDEWLRLKGDGYKYPSSHQTLTLAARPLRRRRRASCQEGSRLPPAAAPKPLPTAKRGKIFLICSKFNFEHPNGQIRAKRSTNEPKIVGKARRRHHGKKQKFSPMRPFPILISCNFFTIVVIILFPTG